MNMKNHLERTQRHLHSIHQSLQTRSSKHGNPKQWYKHVPDLSTKSALVTKNLTKAQWKQDAKAIEAIKAEAAGSSCKRHMAG